jgi:hypothetical protein
MNFFRLAPLILVSAAVMTVEVQSADDPMPPANRPSMDELRSRARRLTPDEREVRLRELRGRLRPGLTNRSELERRRDEWRNLPPAKREARIREFREHNLSGRDPVFNPLTPAERESKRVEIKQRIESLIQELESRKTTGTLTPLEERRLERFRQMSRGLDRGTALGKRNRLGEREREGRDLPPPSPLPVPPPPGRQP